MKPQTIFDPFELQIESDGLSEKFATSSFDVRIYGNKAQFTSISGSNSGVENSLRLFLSQLCFRVGDRFLLHASGVVKDEQAYLFYGNSGAGKSTIIGLIKDQVDYVLSDDLVGLWAKEAGIFASGIPFQGNDPNASCHPGDFHIAGIFFLQKAKHFALTEISSAQFMASLMAAMPFARSEDLKKLHATLVKISVTCNFASLHFQKGEDVWPQLMAELS